MPIPPHRPISAAACLRAAFCLATIVCCTTTANAGPAAVTVVNPANSPVPIRDSDNATQQPFTLQLQAGSTTSPTASSSLAVPAGKRMVIEYYAAQLYQYPVGGYAYENLQVTTSGGQGLFQVVPETTSNAPFNQLTRLYADAGSLVTMTVVSSSGTMCGGRIALSGYYVNVP